MYGGECIARSCGESQSAADEKLAPPLLFAHVHYDAAYKQRECYKMYGLCSQYRLLISSVFEWESIKFY